MKTELQELVISREAEQRASILQRRILQKYIVGVSNKETSEMVLEQLESIYYFASQNHEIEMKSKNSVLITKKTMEKLESKLASQLFIRVSKSYIVNIEHIKRISHYKTDRQFSLLMRDGTWITVTRGYYTSFKIILGID